MLRTIKKATLTVAALTLCAVLASCREGRTAAFQYLPVPAGGWEVGDTLHFSVDTIRQGGDYRLTIGVRTSAARPYPFRSIWLLICQHRHNPEAFLRDTLECKLANERGDALGNGTSLYTSTVKWQTIHLPEGSSADITVNHIMRRDLLQGVTDVGIKLERE